VRPTCCKLSKEDSIISLQFGLSPKLIILSTKDGYCLVLFSSHYK
jgi:hypothetical protein